MPGHKLSMSLCAGAYTPWHKPTLATRFNHDLPTNTASGSIVIARNTAGSSRHSDGSSGVGLVHGVYSLQRGPTLSDCHRWLPVADTGCEARGAGITWPITETGRRPGSAAPMREQSNGCVCRFLAAAPAMQALTKGV